MKKIIVLLIICASFLTNAAQSQNSTDINLADSTGLPGDHFSLQGALELLQKSTSPEDFEKQLNAENKYVNNLDLNGDNEIDYVEVTDFTKGNAHALVLHVATSENETQDIAVIEIEKTGDKNATLQIIGDEDIYGEKKIIEPTSEIDGSTKSGPSAPTVKLIIVNVWFWPCITYIYAPIYSPWVSPWHWRHYPPYWKPWNPHPWRWHYSHCKPYYANYRVINQHRVRVAHQVYLPHRNTSVIVSNRHKPAIQQYRGNHPTRTTYSNGNKPQRSNNIKNQKPIYGPRNGGKAIGKGNSGGGHRR